MTDLFPFFDAARPVLPPPVNPKPGIREERRRAENRNAPTGATGRSLRLHPLPGDALPKEAPQPSDTRTDRKRSEEGKSFSLHSMDFFQPHKPAEQKSPPDQPVSTASRMVSGFKIGYALLVAGAFNAFLFGTPFKVACGLSTAFAALQAYIATKIERADTPQTRKILQFSRKLMKSDSRPEKGADNKPGNKPGSRSNELTMAPVWGGVASLLSLTEAGMNDLYRKIQKFRGRDTEKTFESVIQRIKRNVAEASRFSPMRYLYALQLKTVRFGHSLETEKALTGGKALLANLWNFSRQKVRGNRIMGYGTAVFAGFAGGFFQTVLAALLQKRLAYPEKAPASSNKAG